MAWDLLAGRSLQEALINGVMSSMIGMAIRWLGEATGLIPTHVDAPHYRGTLNGDVHVPGTQRVRPNMDVDTRLSLDAETRINLDPEARVLSPDADRWVTVRSPDGTPHTYRPISEHEIELPDGRRLSRQGGGTSRPDLSSYNLDKTFEDYPVGNYCEVCADELGQRLETDFKVDIVEIQDRVAGPRFVNLLARNPSGREIVVGTKGWHEIVRIEVDGEQYFIDSLVYDHYQNPTPLTWQEYNQLWTYPNDQIIVNSRLPGQPRPTGTNPFVPD